MKLRGRPNGSASKGVLMESERRGFVDYAQNLLNLCGEIVAEPGAAIGRRVFERIEARMSLKA